jgi:hypothetical protein
LWVTPLLVSPLGHKGPSSSMHSTIFISRWQTSKILILWRIIFYT